MTNLNEAREVVLAWLEEPPVADPRDGVEEFNQVSADSLIAYLEEHGFEITKMKSA
jgi:hypothetical protein